MPRPGGRVDEFETIIPTLVDRAEELEPILELDVDAIVAAPWLTAAAGAATTEQRIEYLERFATEVLAPLRSGAAA